MIFFEKTALGSLRSKVLLSALGILVSFFQSAAQAEDSEIVFGLIPALSSDVMVRRFQPLALLLTKETGISVRLAGAPDYETFMNRVL